MASPFAFGYLPPIIGKPMEVCAALKIRQSFIDGVVEHGEEVAARYGDGRVAELIAAIKEQRLAAYWLEAGATTLLTMWAEIARRAT
jgi:hypothetical protein